MSPYMNLLVWNEQISQFISFQCVPLYNFLFSKLFYLNAIGNELFFLHPKQNSICVCVLGVVTCMKMCLNPLFAYVFIKLHSVLALISWHAARANVYLLSRGVETAHRVESSSPWFHYSMLITANSTHFSFTCRCFRAQRSCWSANMKSLILFLFLDFGGLTFQMLPRQGSFDVIYPVSFKFGGNWLYWWHYKCNVCQHALF